MIRPLPLFPVLTAPDWYTDQYNDQWSFDERGPHLTRACKFAIGIRRDGSMPVKFGIKRAAYLMYSPEGCALFNRIADICGGERAVLDYSDCVSHEGLVLQSPCRRYRLLSIYGLEPSEMRPGFLLPGIEMICSGFVNVKGWECASRKSSYGEELHPILMHVLRNGRSPKPDERLDCLPGAAEQLRRLRHSYQTALSEAADLGGIHERHRPEHIAFWKDKAETQFAKYVAAGGHL